MSTVSVYSRNENTTDVWLTPPYIIRALGSFDLDPCAPEETPWRCAKAHYTEKDDGLSSPWAGRVFLNPPYGKVTGSWMEKLSEHGDGVALVFARTETLWFRKFVWGRADGILFFSKRINFLRPDGSSGAGSSAPSVLVAYGKSNLPTLLHPDLPGTLVCVKTGCFSLND